MLRLASFSTLLAKAAPRGAAVDMVELTGVAVDEVEESTDAPRLCERACQFSLVHVGAWPSLTTLPPRAVVRPATRRSLVAGRAGGSGEPSFIGTGPLPVVPSGFVRLSAQLVSRLVRAGRIGC